MRGMFAGMSFRTGSRAEATNTPAAPPNPANTKYLFFVRKPGKTGDHAFSTTDKQFERDVARYQASRGGP